MAYANKYIAYFYSLDGLEYTIQIAELDYVGSVQELTLSGVPALHKWDEDDPKAPIKGSSLEIGLINKGDISLIDFYADEDNTFRITLLKDSDVLFQGFIVQDESSEIEVDYNHEIRLTATDGLGLLKDIDLLTASRIYSASTTYTRNIISSGQQLTVSGSPFVTINGQTLIIDNGGALDGVYTISSTSYIGSTFIINIVENFPVNTSVSGADLILTDPVDLTGRLKYSEILPLCLKATGLSLQTDVISKIIPNGYGGAAKWLEVTLVDGETFLDGDKWDSCYEVIEKIFTAFNATLFQANGRWNIIRWDELRYQANAVTYYRYDADFVYTTTSGTISREFTYGSGDDIATGLLGSLDRSYRNSKRSFDYVQPDNLLVNANFDQLGTLIRTYTSGSDTISEYQLAQWGGAWTGPDPERFIRITVDSVGNELSRIVVITGATGDSSRSAISQPIEVNEGDSIKYSFSYRTDISQPGNVNNVFSVRLFDGTTNYWLKNNEQWESIFGFTFTVFSGDNTNEWHTVEMISSPVPVSGFIYVYLAEATPTGADETWYKDLRFDYIPSVNDSTKIIGHIHEHSQNKKINNGEDIDIFIDDAPSNSIKGTQFLESFTGVVQDRTTLWGYNPAVPGTRKLGEITTFEKLFWRRVPRVKLEGTFLGIIQSTKMLSILSIVEYLNRPDYWFIWGQLEIDYRNDSATGTLYEQWRVGEVDADLESIYNFRYIYETK